MQVAIAVCTFRVVRGRVELFEFFVRHRLDVLLLDGVVFKKAKMADCYLSDKVLLVVNLLVQSDHTMFE